MKPKISLESGRWGGQVWGRMGGHWGGHCPLDNLYDRFLMVKLFLSESIFVYGNCICIWCTKYLSKLYLGESISVTSPLSERKISLFLIPNLIWFRFDKEKLEKTKTDSGVLAFNNVGQIEPNYSQSCEYGGMIR